MINYPNWDLLVSTHSLEAEMNQLMDLVVIDARTKGYSEAHIKGATHLDPMDFTAKDFTLKSVAELEKQLGDKGLFREMNIVIYGTDTSDVQAARVFWMLEYLGCKTVRILEGGWSKWQAELRPIESTESFMPMNIFKACPINSKMISSKDSQSVDEENLLLVDARSYAEFIGWEMHGVKNGGHIKGAISFPYEWGFDESRHIVEYKVLKELLKSKGITTDKTVVVYSTTGMRSCSLFFLLRLMGFEHITVYQTTRADWSNETSLSLQKLSNYEKVVFPEWVYQLIEGCNPPTYPGHDYKIVEVSYGESDSYNRGHIPGAIHVDTNEIEREPLWNIVSDEQLDQFCKKIGVTCDTTSVVYGNDFSAVSRLILVFMYAGVKDIRFLNGGLKAWTTLGYHVESEIYTAVPIEDFGALIPVCPEYVVNTSDVKRMLQSPNAKLVDVRSWDEYSGETSGYTYISPKGRIAGAVWGNSGSDPYHTEDYCNLNGTIRSYTEIQSMWKERGITSDEAIIFYCGTGWRASVAFLHAYLMGWSNISVYDGGWLEWSRSSDNPVENGTPSLHE